MATATRSKAELLTLPVLALRLGLTPDVVRREFKRNPKLAALARQAGRAFFIEGEDFEKAKELLKGAAAGAARG